MGTRVGVIIVAGGSGSRMGGETPKQFLLLGGKPILMHTVGRFAEALPESKLVVVLPQAHIAHWTALCEEHGFTTPHTVVPGGTTRFESVKNGLNAAADCDCIGVHDGVRPLVGKDLILSVLEASQEFGAAIPAVPLSDSLREITPGGSRPVDRDRFVAVQTPQFFRAPLLIRAYDRPDMGFTDDASVVEACGVAVALVPGEAANIKITTPADLAVAERLSEL